MHCRSTLTCRLLRLTALIVLACVGGVVASTAMAAEWSCRQSDGGLVLERDGEPFLTMRYVGWGPNYKWADVGIKAGAQPGQIAGGFYGLDVMVEGRIRKTDPRTIGIEYNLDARKASSGNKGGGVQFTVALGEDDPKPTLLKEQTGWAWQGPDGARLRVTLEGPAVNARFDRGDPAKPRLLFVPNTISEGGWRTNLIVRLPEGTRIDPALPEGELAAPSEGFPEGSRVEARAAAVGPDWRRDTVRWDGAAIDVSWLNHKPAGKHGFVEADGDRLVFADGTPARFWGCNVTARAATAQSKESIALQAERIAAMGFNLVRLHHVDSNRWVHPNIFAGGDSTQRLNDTVIDRIDWWVHCLKKHGVYVWLDLHVGRRFKRGDEIPGFGELEVPQGSQSYPGEAKAFNFVNPRIEALMQDFAEAYLTHTNPYTGLRAVDDPAVAGVGITNENLLTNWRAVMFHADKDKPVHRQMYRAIADPIAKRLGLDEAVHDELHKVVGAKLIAAEIEHRFYRRAVEHLRGIGLRCQIACNTLHGEKEFYTVPALAAGTLIDQHEYAGPDLLRCDPRLSGNWVHGVVGSLVADKPSMITEWGVRASRTDRFNLPLYAASHAAFQQIDGLCLFSYDHEGVAPKQVKDWNAGTDPELAPLMAAAAVLYRQGHVTPARQTMVTRLTGEQLFHQKLSSAQSLTLRTLAEQHGVRIALPEAPELPWLEPTAVPEDMEPIKDLQRDHLPEGAERVVSDTGELTRDWAAGVFTVDTPRSQAASGALGGRRIELGDLTIEMQTERMALACTSLDGRPIAASERLLLTLATPALPTQDGTGPWASAPVKGSVSFARASPQATATAIHPDGSPGRSLPLRDGRVLTFDGDLATHWVLLEVAAP